MKKLIYLIALAVLITACGKDDETPNYIIGTWQLDCYYVDYVNNPVDFNKATDYEYHKVTFIQNLTFLVDTACGMIYDFPNNPRDNSSYSYYTENNYLYTTKQCSDNEKLNRKDQFRANKNQFIHAVILPDEEVVYRVYKRK